MKEDIRNPFVGLKEIYSHSALVTNDRIDKMMRRIELYCEMCWNDPRREHLLAYFSALKTAFNEIFPIIKDEEEYSSKESFHHNLQNYLKPNQEHNITHKRNNKTHKP